MNNIFKILFFGWILVIFFNLCTMDCLELCKKLQNLPEHKECFETCLKNTNHQITIAVEFKDKNPLSEEEARQEWSRRYPYPPFEESDCYYPYRGDYKKGVTRDNKKKK